MSRIIISLFIFLFCIGYLSGQNEAIVTYDSLPYLEIPDYPEDFSPGSMVARMVDGLGYRYHWATKNLQDEALDYKPGETNRTISETLEHILILTRTMLTVSKGQPVKRPGEETPESFKARRTETLNNIAAIRTNLVGKTEEEIAQMNIVFQRGDTEREFPFWNFLNGPLADAIYHTGQIIAFRRAAGDPVDPGMNVFTGKKR